MSSNLISLGGWYILPNLVTGWVQSAYYAIWIRAGEPKPQPGSRVFNAHRKRIHILVVLAYLLYTIYEADWQLQQAGDFYRDLGVPHNVDDRGLQSRFRRLTITHHPDKISDAAARPAAEALYVHLKLCRDVLADPAKRYAYDRFGPDILQWQHCTTMADYVKAGVQSTVMYYAGTGAVLVLLGLVGYLKQAPFWRYLAMISLFTFELSTMTRPTPTSSTQSSLLQKTTLDPLLAALTLFRPPYLPFQTLSLARKLIFTFFIALSQIGPLLSSPSAGGGGAGGSGDKQMQGQQLDRLDATLANVDQEVGRLMALELTPFAAADADAAAAAAAGVSGATAATTGESAGGGNGNGSGSGSGMQELRSCMRRWLVDNTVRSNAEVRTAIGRVVERRRVGAPAGAVGAR